MHSIINAIGRGDIKAVKKYIEDGKDVNAKDKEHKRSLLDWALFCTSVTNKMEITQLFIDAGAKVNCKDKWGYTPLLTATYPVIWHQYQALLGTLLEKGAKPDVYDRDEKSVLERWVNSITQNFFPPQPRLDLVNDFCSYLIKNLQRYPKLANVNLEPVYDFIEKTHDYVAKEPGYTKEEKEELSTILVNVKEAIETAKKTNEKNKSSTTTPALETARAIAAGGPLSSPTTPASE